MLRALMSRVPVMVRAPALGCNTWSPASFPAVLASHTPHMNVSVRRGDGTGTRLHRVRHRGVHTMPILASDYHRADRSQRYSIQDALQAPRPAPTAPSTPAPTAPASPAPAPPAPASQPPGAVRRPVRPQAPKPQPAPTPPQPAATQQPSSPAEVLSEDYGMLVRPGAGRMVLVDALPLLYKAHFAFPPDARLRSAQGVDTTVVYVFLNMLLNLLGLSPAPTHFAVVFDAAGKNFRHELYPDYKGQRPDMPREIREAIPQLRSLLGAMGLPVFSVAGVEADDVLGTLAVRAVQEGMVVAIASPDKDFFQLLRMGLILLRPPKKQQYHPAAPPAPAGEGGEEAAAAAPPQQQQAAGGATAGAGGGARRISKFMLLPYTEADFREEWKLSPAQFVDLLALAGDASDNVPGVSGIGPKTAAALLQQFGSLEELLAQAGEVGKRAGAMLQSIEGGAAARLSKQLVRIETALDIPPLKVPLDDLRLRPPPDGGKAILEMCRQLDLKTHEERLRKLWAGPAFQPSPGGGGIS